MYNINIYFKLRNSNALLNSKILKLYHAPKVYARIKDLRSEVLRYHIPPCGKAVWKVNHFEKIFFQSELKKNQSALLMCINIFSSSEILWSPICLASVYLSVRCSVPYVCNLFTFLLFSRTTGLISIKIGANYLLAREIQICENEIQ